MKTRDAFEVAVKLLAGRDKSEARLREGLGAREFSAAEVDQAVVRLKRMKYLDDSRSAAEKTRVGLAAGKTPAQVRLALVRGGFDERLVAQALSDALDEAPYDAEAHARLVLARTRKTGVAAARMLASRGFDEAVITKLVHLPGAAGEE